MEGGQSSGSARRSVAGALLVALTLGSTPLLTAPAAVAAASTSAVSMSAASIPAHTVVAVAGRVEQEPTADQVAASQQRAADLHVEVQQHTDALAAGRAALAEAARQATISLQAYRSAVQARQNAQVAQESADQQLDQARLGVAEQQAVLGRWARQAYAAGGTLTDSPAAVTLLQGGSTDDVATALDLLTRVGRSHSRAVERLTAAQAAQTTATALAAGAAAAAVEAERGSLETQAARDAAVAAQLQQVDQLSRQLATTNAASAQADREAAVLAQARAVAEQWHTATTGVGGNVVTGPVGDCAGGDTALYGNGEIPLAALCPIHGAPGESLRADAAFAFNRLSQAYQGVFGVPICVTDSYRSYDDQVRVYAEKPGLAAHPGTSNHGWGTAADLCGGIESFDAPTHAWMLANAPLFGWFHPAWAEPTGSKPEPWHWEFGG